MKKDQVQIGGTYVAKVSGQLARVRIDAESRLGGWDATNVSTHRKVRIKSAQRLRWKVTSEKTAGQASAETAVVPDDRPPQDIDERIAAAPPSIVPYEQRRARAVAANAKAAADADIDDEPPRDPDRCATKRCRGTPVMTHLGRPLCQVCWERHCVDDAAAEFIEKMDHELEPAAEVPEGADATVAAADLIETASAPVQKHEETNMATTSKTAKQTTKKTTNAKGATTAATTAKSATAKSAKAAGTRKATAGKAERAVKSASAPKSKRVSALDAAAQVLAKAGKPMHAQELVTAMGEQGLWKSPGGKTPHATLYAAMMREERDKGRESRFRKVDRGQFAFNGKGA